MYKMQKIQNVMSPHEDARSQGVVVSKEKYLLERCMPISEVTDDVTARITASLSCWIKANIKWANDIHWQNCLSIELKCAKAFSASQVINTRQSYIVESILQCISTCVYLSRHPLSATINILTFISEGLLCFTGMQMMFKKMCPLLAAKHHASNRFAVA